MLLLNCKRCPTIRRCDNPNSMWRCWLITAALAAASDDLPSNMVTLRNVCVQETIITLHASTADAKGQLCGLTACHAPQARTPVSRERRRRVRGRGLGRGAAALPGPAVDEAYVATARPAREWRSSLRGQHRPRPLQRVVGRFIIARAALRRAVHQRHVVHGRQSWDAASLRGGASWSLTVVDALFNETSTPLYWASDAHMVGSRCEHLPSLGGCADVVVVRAQGRLAENVGWDASLPCRGCGTRCCRGSSPTYQRGRSSRDCTRAATRDDGLPGPASRTSRRDSARPKC